MKIFNRKFIISFLTFLGVYFLSAGISFAVFSFFLPTQQTISGTEEERESENLRKGEFLIDISGPKTEACPLNHSLFTKAEKNAWEKRRPLLVMIENHEDARPQSGLSKADVVYEAVAEGGITRFMAVYYCEAQAQDVILGPVRSARTYYLDWASEYGGYPLYAHVGGANTPGPANALGQIETYGWGGAKGNDLNQFSIGYPTFWRDYERLGRTVLTEHTMYSTTEKLWNVAKARGWTNLSPEGEDWQAKFKEWQFTDKELALAERGEVKAIEFEFWKNSPKYKVRWEYDKTNNLYLRVNGGQPHKDLNNDQQLTVKNVIILFLKESSANDGYENNLHLLYGTIGEGKALFFQNGQVIKGIWKKSARLERTRFYDEKGKEIKLVPGKIWLEILPTGTVVEY